MADMKATKRPIRVEGSIAYIPLTKGYEAIIDAADVPLVDGINWRAKPHGKTIYATASSPKNGGGQRTIYLHRVIMLATEVDEVDHRDGNGLNNRRLNMRAANHAQNCQNRSVRRDNLSGVKGCMFSKAKNAWIVRIVANGKRKTVGMFSTSEDAHRAYSAASEKYHGEFGRVQ